MCSIICVRKALRVLCERGLGGHDSKMSRKFCLLLTSSSCCLSRCCSLVKIQTPDRKRLSLCTSVQASDCQLETIGRCVLPAKTIQIFFLLLLKPESRTAELRARQMIHIEKMLMLMLPSLTSLTQDPKPHSNKQQRLLAMSINTYLNVPNYPKHIPRSTERIRAPHYSSLPDPIKLPVSFRTLEHDV